MMSYNVGGISGGDLGYLDKVAPNSPGDHKRFFVNHLLDLPDLVRVPQAVECNSASQSHIHHNQKQLQVHQQHQQQRNSLVQQPASGHMQQQQQIQQASQQPGAERAGTCAAPKTERSPASAPDTDRSDAQFTFRCTRATPITLACVSSRHASPSPHCHLMIYMWWQDRRGTDKLNKKSKLTLGLGGAVAADMGGVARTTSTFSLSSLHNSRADQKCEMVTG
ncbi:hypothetical protein E2C01_062321 [Portunus trituberculatus]|uniref:Uncharacterized protein n=1 Tax=Portunus trituberculatus TaxID=210409 RepID=A0A5B7HDQ8_PORTR|nr:hypothetical protein [Portunus trituberculatus]